jgi:hypothetical protein
MAMGASSSRETGETISPKSHLSSIGAIGLNLIGVVIATPVVRFFFLTVWHLRDGVWFVPDALTYYVVKLPLEFMMGLSASSLAFLMAAMILKRADHMIVAYTTTAIYGLIIIALFWTAFALGEASGVLLTASQAIGILLGVWAGKECAK